MIVQGLLRLEAEKREEHQMDFAIIPRMLLEKLECESERRIHLNVLLSTALLFMAAFILVRHKNVLELVPHVCVAQALFGIPCPGCGITRSALAFLTGNIGQAWSMNPAGPVLCATTAFQVPLRCLVLTGKCESRIALNTSRFFTAVVVTFLIGNWLTCIL
jgi:hypothetical protein